MWRRTLQGGGVAVALLNRGEATARIAFTFEQIGLGWAAALVADVWAAGPAVNVNATAGFGAAVGPHAAEVFVLTKT